MIDLEGFVAAQGEWADSVFIGQTVQGKLEHLAEEVREIMASPQDPMEYADAAMLLFDAARTAGISVEEVFHAMRQKLDINRSREWRDFRHVRQMPEVGR